MISVIIPTYNREKFLPATIDSVLRQTYSNYEIIVVDDGSTDGTQEVIEKLYGGKLKYIYKDNGGHSSARNVGLKNASGNYIAFLDSDDLWFPEKLETQVRFMEKNKQYAMTFTWFSSFTENMNGEIHDIAVGNYEKSPSIRDLLICNYIPQLTVMVRTKCFEKVGHFDENPSLIIGEDHEMWIRIFAEFKVGYVPMVLARYRIHDDSLTRKSPNRWAPFNNHMLVINNIYNDHPELINDNFGSMRRYIAECSAVWGDNRIFSIKNRRRLYLKSLLNGNINFDIFQKLLQTLFPKKMSRR